MILLAAQVASFVPLARAEPLPAPAVPDGSRCGRWVKATDCGRKDRAEDKGSGRRPPSALMLPPPGGGATAYSKGFGCGVVLDDGGRVGSLKLGVCR